VCHVEEEGQDADDEHDGVQLPDAQDPQRGGEGNRAERDRSRPPPCSPAAPSAIRPIMLMCRRFGNQPCAESTQLI
jgi:hypothetical protein